MFKNFIVILISKQITTDGVHNSSKKSLLKV
jgi:hypothetical protein